MTEAEAGRVVVGIRDSLAGYQALRYAVAQARERQASLLVVRGFNGTSPGSAPWDATLAEAPAGDVRAVVRQTCGGLPRDVKIQMVSREGVTGAALVGAADRPADLLVIGGS